MYTRFDFRFLAKIAIGIAYCLFGKKVLDSNYGKELHKALKYKEGEEMPSIYGSSMLSDQKNPSFNKLIGHPFAVNFVVLPTPEGAALNLNIGTHLNWTILCASREALDTGDFDKIRDGLVVTLFRPLQKGFSFSLPRYLAHQSGAAPIPELVQITMLAKKHGGSQGSR